MSESLVKIENLKTHFFTEAGVVKAVDDVSLDIPRGKTLGLVGESGCGKSVTAMSILQLVSSPGRIVDGSITLFDDDKPIVLTDLNDDQMRSIRGSRVSMIFQEPMSSLNPVFTIGSQIAEAVMLHQKATKADAWALAVEMLDKVRIPDPWRRAKEYPHQFSGGMRQRAMIAMALSCNPSLLIADEPTTALDVTIQAQVLDLLMQLQKDFGMSILMITHDLGIIAETADEVAVMYASKVVEKTEVAELFNNQMHPYTLGLFASRPDLGQAHDEKLATIAGEVPNLLTPPSGCKFHPRCPYAQDVCSNEEPELREIKPGHDVRCHFAGKLETLQSPRRSDESSDTN